MRLSNHFQKAAGFLRKAAMVGCLSLATLFAGCVSPGLNHANAHKYEILDPGGPWNRTISVPYIIVEGEIPSYKPIINLFVCNYKIDWNANDAFIRALDTIQTRSAERIDNSYTLKELLKKDHWTRQDRVKWERELSRIVSQELDRIPGLDTYRTDAHRSSFLNALSKDIENHTTEIEFDCEAMAIIEGIMLQNLDYHYLPKQAAEDGDYKEASKYYYANGFVQWQGDKSTGGHAFIISDATSGIIEATSQYGTPYYEVVNPDYTIADFIHGIPAVAYRADRNSVDVYSVIWDWHVSQRAREDLADEIKAVKDRHNIYVSYPAEQPKAPPSPSV